MKVTDLCPAPENEQWCGQTTSNPTNQFGAPVQCVVSLPAFPLFFSSLGSPKESALADIFIMRLCSFDLCEDTGAAAQFFPSGHTALTGTFSEVSCSEWSGSDGGSLWNGACLSGESAALWPSGTGCGNQGEWSAFKGVFLGRGGGKAQAEFLCVIVIRNRSLKTDVMMRNFGWPMYLVWGQLCSSENKGLIIRIACYLGIILVIAFMGI